MVPTHQGRAAERILFESLDVRGRRVLSNTLFDTTQANCEANGGIATNIPVGEARQPSSTFPFKVSEAGSVSRHSGPCSHRRCAQGNIDLDALAGHLRNPSEVACCVFTVTNNSGGGQPATLANITAASSLCRAAGVPIILDACRFAENAWFIKQGEAHYADASIPQIARAMFDVRPPPHCCASHHLLNQAISLPTHP